MHQKNPPGIFIVGTNTEVGKTHVACAIARSLKASGARVGVYKPAASGAEWRDEKFVSTDAQQLWEAAGRPLTLDAVCPQVFAAPLAPHLAARAEGRELDAARLRSGFDVWREGDWDVVLVEGAGGLLSPISDQDLVADLALDLQLPLLLVVPNALGMIAQTLQAAVAAHGYRRPLQELLRQTGASAPQAAGERLRLAGIVLNQPQAPDDTDESLASNRGELERLCPVPVAAELHHGADGFVSSVDWRTWIASLPSPNAPRR